MRTVALHSVVHGAPARGSGLYVLPGMAFQGVLRTTLVGTTSHLSHTIPQILLTKLSAHVTGGMLEKTDYCEREGGRSKNYGKGEGEHRYPEFDSWAPKMHLSDPGNVRIAKNRLFEKCCSAKNVVATYYTYFAF
jgi:hypothetical protein